MFTGPVRRRRFDLPETLPAAARPQFEALDFWERFQRMGFRYQYAMSSAWGNDLITTRHSICNPAGPGWFVNRAVFDAELSLHAASKGATVIPARVASVSRSKDRWILHSDASEPAAGAPVGARLVVDATGRSSAFARRMGVRRFAFDRQVCISALATPRCVPTGEALVESEPEGWWFSALTERGDLAIAWFTEASLLRPEDRSIAGFERRLRAARHTAARLERVLPKTLQSAAASTDWLEVCAGDGWFAAGDAALACDPLSSQGVLRALESAEIVSEMILNYSTKKIKYIREYSDFQKRRLERFLRDRRYFYDMERRWPEAAFWRQRASSFTNRQRVAV
jgi:flavin-dependent dehydrogenase